MPEFGKMGDDRIVAVTSDGDGPSAPWALNGVTAQLTTFEVDVTAALENMPSLTARPAPAYARILVLDVPDSPVGPYREAQLLVSCRYLMLPRQYIAASIVTTEAAQQANARNWHYRSEIGEISVEGSGDNLRSVIRGANGLEIVIASHEPQATAPASIRYDPTVVAQPKDAGIGLFTISADPDEIREAWIDRGATVAYQGGDRKDPWLRLRSRNPITSTVAVQDMQRPEPEEVKATAVGAA